MVLEIRSNMCDKKIGRMKKEIERKEKFDREFQKKDEIEDTERINRVEKRNKLIKKKNQLIDEKKPINV